MSLELYRDRILKRFMPKDVIGYCTGDLPFPDWDQLASDVELWWKFYKEEEKKDTVAEAYKQQRLTVKGTSDLDVPMQAQDPNNWGDGKTFEKPRPKQKTAAAQRYMDSLPPEYYRIKKTNESIMDRLKPENFLPPKGGESQKTELGLHDLSAGLMNPKEPISAQQYKTVSKFQTYVFMPLSHAGDQAVYQNINMLAKAHRNERPNFYIKVREIRSQMTRVKLAAEHDMATSFIVVGSTPQGRPKFKFELLEKTDVSTRDQEKGLVAKNVDFGGNKVIQQPTTLEILQARKHAALNFQSLILGEMLRYGEVVVAYRQHAGDFPKFARFDTTRSVWVVGNIGQRGYQKRIPEETIPDQPT